MSFRFATLNRVEAYPRGLANLYLDRPLVLYGRCPRTEQRVVLQVIGKGGGADYDMVFEIDLAAAAPGDKDMPRAWAWQRIYHLIGEHTRTSSPAVLKELEDTAKAYGLKVPYGGKFGAE